MKNTIVSLITPPLMGAIAVIRISGDDAVTITQNIFVGKSLKPNGVSYGYIVDENKEKVDQVLVTYFKAPHSFTGEDVIEISCHGSMIIANEIISLILANGARLAQRGEFSSRAYLNNKIDLVQAEAINSLINANTIESKKLALYSLQGETSSLLTPIITSLADLLSNIEVNIDYPEYQDIEEITISKVITKSEENIKEIDKLLNQSQKSQMFISGIKVAIVGLPNTGKSSLLNAFLNEEKAIVTDIPGTTRDVVEGDISLGGVPIHLLDTAGIRKADNLVEQIGVEKSQKMIDEADLVIMVLDSTKKITNEEKELMNLLKNKKHIIVYNKVDLIKEIDDEKIYISAMNKNISPLKNKILDMFGITTKDITPSLCSSREIGLLKKAKSDLIKAKEDAEYSLSLDLIAVSLKEAYDALKEIIGQTINVDLSEEIFSRFCVGK